MQRIGSYRTAAEAHPDTRTLLTPQEQSCLRLVARRMSSKEIAEHLGIAKTSVDTYCNRARQKLGVSDRYAAARLLVTQSPLADVVEPAGPVPAPAPRTARLQLALAAGALVATALGLSALLAGMAALEALKPPGWDAQQTAAEPPPAPSTVARDG